MLAPAPQPHPSRDRREHVIKNGINGPTTARTTNPVFFHGIRSGCLTIIDILERSYESLAALRVLYKEYPSTIVNNTSLNDTTQFISLLAEAIEVALRGEARRE